MHEVRPIQFKRCLMVAVGVSALAAALPALAQTRLFDIEAQRAATGIPKFGRQAQLQILAAQASVEGKQVNPVQGVFSVDEGLRRLLSGTNLTVVSNNGRTAIVAEKTGNVILASNTLQQPTEPAPSAAPSVPTPPEEPIQVEDIVVTGTSLRGVAPVGANLVSVGRQAIEDTGAQTVSQILRTVPSITGLGAVAQGQTAGNSYYSPTIHSLGSSASNSTLVLIDGHRMPIGGINHALPDPNMVPPIALERVEVLAEGASSTYGSDAVAGVVNFITRKNYEGLEFTGQAGFGNSYRTYSAGALWGHRWDSGSVLAAYGYSKQDALPNGHGRDFLQPDHRDEGGTNFQSFNCAPATIQPAGSSGIYGSPTATTTIANVTANSPCDASQYSDRLPAERRHNLMVKVEQLVGDRLKISGDIIYSNRRTLQQVARGSVQATVFATGGQANPFYVNPPGVTAVSQTVRFQADELLGRGAISDAGAETWSATGNFEYKINDNFRATLLTMIGQDETYQLSTGTLCGSCANLALNDTTNSAGNPLTPSIPGTTVIVTTLPLTAQNALDVWNVGSANRTSAAVRARLIDNRTSQRGKNVIKQARAGIDGSLFRIYGGDVRVAVGAEILDCTLDTAVDRPLNVGPSSTGSASTFFPLDRTVKSAYGELLVPIISPENNIPFVRKLDVNVSGRYDHYSIFGSTKNPKVASSWEVVEGLKFRGNWSKSFVAPSMRSFGNEQGVYNDSGYTSYSENISIPVSAFPDIIGLPGCPAGSTVCQIGGNIQGIRVTSGNRSLKPQRGRTWSLGADFAPPQIPGLQASITWFNNKLIGGITSPSLPIVISSPTLRNLLTFYPNGATPAQIAAATVGVPQTGTLPATVYYINNFTNQNVANLDIGGLDIAASYRLTTDDLGTFTIGGSATRFVKFDQNFAGGKTFSVLNTTGFNTTFPSIRTTARANMGWDMGPLSADLFANYVGAYRNYSTGTVKPIVVVDGRPTGGGDRVRSNLTIDLHVAYRLPEDGFWGRTQVYIDATNIFDRDPPFYNAAAGYDPYGANPIGRVVNLGLRAKF